MGEAHPKIHDPGGQPTGFEDPCRTLVALRLSRATRCGSNTGLAIMLNPMQDRWSAQARIILPLLALATLTLVTCRTTLSKSERLELHVR